MTNLVPVILAGGSGSRLWPTSRKSYPKQFLDLTDSGDTLLQLSLKRAQVLLNAYPCIIVTSEDYRFLVAQQAKESKVPIGSILLESSPRNTAAAIALAALEALDLYDSPRLLVQTADHYIRDPNAFGEVISQALQSSAPFILFGVEPTRPETGYGYIACGDELGVGFKVESFKEKPDSFSAQTYLESSKYLWNSGIFLLDAQAYLDALKKFEPAIYTACTEAFQNTSSDLDFKRVDGAAFDKSPCVSVDYAVIERCDNLVVIKYPGQWSDVGAWDSVAEYADHDTFGNSIQGDGILFESKNTFIRAESRLVVAMGLEDIVIVEARDAVMVCNASKTQDVKNLVEHLVSQGRTEGLEHPKVHRPWGFYETLIAAEKFLVKQLCVYPGASLSLQMHNHRAEHWIVVSGEAQAQIDNQIHTLQEDESVYIPLGSKHRLTNPGKLILTVIEVQSGSYISEEDILRFADIYGRDQ